jgi:NAD-dependent deacetylase
MPEACFNIVPRETWMCAEGWFILGIGGRKPMMEIRIPKDIRERFTSAKRVAVLTGAGVSAESGVETYRGQDGTWSKVRIDEVATPQAFTRDPLKVWRYYNERRVYLAKVNPNPAHFALAAMERHFENFVLITQNVDGLHAKAGSKNIIELHGNLWKVIDTATGEESFNYEAPFEEIPPRSNDGHLLRPGVVWFGEMLPEGAMERAGDAASGCEVFLVVGTSAVVYPAAALPLYAKRAGAMVLEFTLQPTEISDLVDHSFQGKAGETLPPFLELIGESI